MILKIAERIHELHDIHSLTQSDLARKLGITRASVNAWEMGISIPSTEKIAELCICLHTTADYLLGISNKEVVSLDGYDYEEKEMLYRMLKYFDEMKKLKS